MYPRRKKRREIMVKGEYMEEEEEVKRERERERERRNAELRNREEAFDAGAPDLNVLPPQHDQLVAMELHVVHSARHRRLL
jgi:hypothetical protein